MTLIAMIVNLIKSSSLQFRNRKNSRRESPNLDKALHFKKLVTRMSPLKHLTIKMRVATPQTLKSQRKEAVTKIAQLILIKSNQ